ncbi:MAG: DNA/RNA non-specific endonuclease [Bdellovibrio sp.]|nr:DNA/RNA non-specific endonuclease [Bdellovibrio sp.]
MQNSSSHIHRSVFLVLVSIMVHSAAFARVDAVLGPLKLEDNPNLVLLAPISDHPEIMLSRPQYVISYNKERRAPNWVSWRLQLSDLGRVTRSNDFSADADLDQYFSQTLKSNDQAVVTSDYSGSCFTRGHQAPSGDRTDSVPDNQTTFFMSNMIPQTSYLNSVIWQHLEEYTRDLVQTENKTLFIIDGPIYDQDYGSIGPKNDIKIPSKNFKVVVILDANQTAADITNKTEMIAVIMPNILEDGRPPIRTPDNKTCSGFQITNKNVSKDDWKQYITTVADIEKQSGIEIFPALKNK